MNIKPLSVTIGIPALNEGHSIVELLDSIRSQESKYFVIEKIIIVSDGSTDDTVLAVKSVRDSRITVVDNKVNRGRVASRNEIIKQSKSDVLVFLDADGRFENKHSLNNLINPFLHDSSIALVSGNPHSIGPDTYLNKCFVASRAAYSDIRKSIKNGNNVHSCFGGILAIARKLYKTIEIPNDIYADDSYIYLSCLSQNYTFINVPTARVIHQFPENLKAHIKRTSRHNKSSVESRKYFGELADKEFAIPRSVFIRAGLKQFIRHPLYTASIYCINFYIKRKAKNG